MPLKDQELEEKIDTIETEMSHLELDQNFFFIWQQNQENFRNKSIEIHLDDEKMNIIGVKEFISTNFRKYLKESIEQVDLRGKYLIGLQTSSLDWLMDIFSEISQTKNFLKFYDYVKKLLNKIK